MFNEFFLHLWDKKEGTYKSPSFFSNLYFTGQI
jgi:hypothetical protein